MGYLNYLFNAGSSLTALGKTFNKSVQYRNLTEMHQDYWKQPNKIKKQLKDNIELTRMTQMQIMLTNTNAKMKKRRRKLMAIQLIQELI